MKFKHYRSVCVTPPSQPRLTQSSGPTSLRFSTCWKNLRQRLRCFLRPIFSLFKNCIILTLQRADKYLALRLAHRLTVLIILPHPHPTRAQHERTHARTHTHTHMLTISKMQTLKFFSAACYMNHVCPSRNELCSSIVFRQPCQTLGSVSVRYRFRLA
jgi:hypothetical protein